MDDKLELIDYRKRTSVETNICDGELIPKSVLESMGLFLNDNNKVCMTDYIIGKAWAVKIPQTFNRLPHYKNHRAYGIKIDKLSANISRIFMNEENLMKQKKPFSATRNKSYFLLGLHSEGIFPRYSLINQFYDCVDICAERGHFIIPLTAYYEHSGLIYPAFSDFNLSRYGNPETVEDLKRIIRDQLKHFKDLEIADDTEEDNSPYFKQHPHNNCLGTGYTTDYSVNPETHRKERSLIKCYDKAEKENEKENRYRIEILISDEVDMFNKFLTPEFLDKSTEEIIEAVRDGVVKKYNKTIGDFNDFSESIPYSQLLSFFSGRRDNPLKIKRKSNNPVINTILKICDTGLLLKRYADNFELDKYDFYEEPSILKIKCKISVTEIISNFFTPEAKAKKWNNLEYFKLLQNPYITKRKEHISEPLLISKFFNPENESVRMEKKTETEYSEFLKKPCIIKRLLNISESQIHSYGFTLQYKTREKVTDTIREYFEFLKNPYIIKTILRKHHTEQTLSKSLHYKLITDNIIKNCKKITLINSICKIAIKYSMLIDRISIYAYQIFSNPETEIRPP